MANNNPFYNEDEIPEIVNELNNPYSKGSASMNGVNFDGNQHNGKHGSPNPHQIGGGGWAQVDFSSGAGGINYDNTQSPKDGEKIAMDDDMGWENSMKVLNDPTKTFKDIHDKMFKEVDLKNDNSGGIGLHEKPMGDCCGY